MAGQTSSVLRSEGTGPDAAYATLAAEQERLHLALQASGDAVIDLDLSTGAATASARWLEIIGTPDDGRAPTARSLLGLVDPRDRASLLDEWRLWQAGRVGRLRHELRVRHADGGTRWIQARGVICRDPSGRPNRIVVVARDVTALRQLESERDRLFQLTTDLLAVCDRDGYIRRASDSWESLLGYSQAQMRALSIEDAIHPEDRAELKERLAESARTGEPIEDLDIRVITAAGHPRWVSWSSSPSGENTYVIARDITGRRQHTAELRAQNQQLGLLARLDPLTGLPNRRLMEDYLAQAVARADRRRDGIALLFVDLDDFKEVNDAHGHSIGDAVLTAIGTRLKAVVRRSDIVARVGGDEFVVAAEGLTRAAEIERVGETILRAVREPNHVSGAPVVITASIGTAVYPVHGRSAADVLARADEAMYRAKRNGGDRIVAVR